MGERSGLRRFAGMKVGDGEVMGLVSAMVERVRRGTTTRTARVRRTFMTVKFKRLWTKSGVVN